MDSALDKDIEHTLEMEGEYGHDGGAAEHGVKDSQYVVIAAILAGLTAIEVSTYYVDFGPLFYPVLIILMVIKFILVVSYFMHLKFDSKIFSWMFYSGLILALFVYAAALATFHFWSPG
jgi:cytochrome c oxidase subunit 4